MENVSDASDAVSSGYVMPRSPQISHFQRMPSDRTPASSEPHLKGGVFGWLLVEAKRPTLLNRPVSAFEPLTLRRCRVTSSESILAPPNNNQCVPWTHVQFQNGRRKARETPLYCAQCPAPCRVWWRKCRCFGIFCRLVGGPLHCCPRFYLRRGPEGRNLHHPGTCRRHRARGIVAARGGGDFVLSYICVRTGNRSKG